MRLKLPSDTIMWQATIVFILFMILHLIKAVLFRLETMPIVVIDHRLSPDAIVDNAPQVEPRDAKGRFTKKSVEAE